MASTFAADERVSGPLDIDVELVPLNVTVRHRDYQQALQSAFGERCFDAGEEVLRTGDRVVLRRTFEGTPQRMLQLGKTLVPVPTQPVKFVWVEEYALQGPRAISARAYLDLSALDEAAAHVEPRAGIGSSEHLVLVPGFLGFDAFGDRQGARIEYFDHVERDVLAVRPDLARHIHVQRTSPTAAVEWRVKGLFEMVLGVLGSAWLEDVEQRRKVIHLVGHSTGGLDVYLLTHPGYAWSGMTAAERTLRARMLEHIGTVVTLSAPLFGTPIARNLRRPFTGALNLLFVLDLIQRLGLRRGPLQVPAIAATLLGRAVPMFGANAPLLRLAGGFDAETARQLSRYWGSMIGDAQCMVDLAPEQAARVMTPLLDEGGRGFPRVRHYVTGAPRPELTLRAPLRSLAYALAYLAASDPGFTPKDVAEGTWLVEDAGFPGLEAPPRRNDGVVPSSSQAIPGNPTSFVVADHLDVVGHFEDQENTTLFRSGSGFGPAKHAQLWAHIALALQPAPGARGACQAAAVAPATSAQPSSG